MVGLEIMGFFRGAFLLASGGDLLEVRIRNNHAERSRGVSCDVANGAVGKDFLLKVIQQFSGMYLSEILAFCIMGNHFHLLVKMLPESDFSDKEIRKNIIVTLAGT